MKTGIIQISIFFIKETMDLNYDTFNKPLDTTYF